MERLPRIAGLWLDRDAGLLRWAPLLALVFFAGWLLYRSRRDQLARVALARREAEACAGLLLGVVGAQLLVVALFSAGGLRGATFPGVPLVAALPALAALTAWGLRHIPRPLAARAGAVHARRRACGWCWPSAAAASRGWLEVDTTRRGARPSTSSRTSPARRCGRRCCARCSPPGAAALWWRERRAAGEWRRAAAASRTSKAMH